MARANGYSSSYYGGTEYYTWYDSGVVINENEWIMVTTEEKNTKELCKRWNIQYEIGDEKENNMVTEKKDVTKIVDDWMDDIIDLARQGYDGGVDSDIALSSIIAYCNAVKTTVKKRGE